LGYVGKKHKKVFEVSQEESLLMLDAWDCIKLPRTADLPEKASFISLAVFLNLINNVYIDKMKRV